MLDGAVAGIVIQVAHAGHAVGPNALFEQELVNVHNPATGEDLLESITLQLVEARSAGHDHRADVQIVQRIGDPVKQYAVVGRDFLGLRRLAGPALWIAAA